MISGKWSFLSFNKTEQTAFVSFNDSEKSERKWVINNENRICRTNDRFTHCSWWGLSRHLWMPCDSAIQTFCPISSQKQRNSVEYLGLTWGVEGTNNTPSLLVRPKRERQVLFFTRLLAATRSKNLKLSKRCSGYNTTLKQLYRKKADDQGPLKDFILIKNTTSVTYWTFVPTQVGTKSKSSSSQNIIDRNWTWQLEWHFQLLGDLVLV